MSLSESDLKIALRCVSELLDGRRLRGAPIPQWLRDHHRRVEAEFLTSTLSASGQEQRISALDAAQLLGMSARNVRRKRDKLDGQKHGRDWTFSGRAVEQYARERQRN
jgi:hypothetical protein